MGQNANAHLERYMSAPNITLLITKPDHLFKFGFYRRRMKINYTKLKIVLSQYRRAEIQTRL